jgi:hypothetical protein
MSIDLETDLRREFDAVRPPASLTFSPESVVSTGRRTIRRRRLIATGTAALAVFVIAAGATLLTSPSHKAAPRPATSTTPTGIVLAQTGHMWGGQSEVRFNRDPAVPSNVRFSVLGKDERRHELGVASTGMPGQQPTAVWRSGMVDGHPVTLGVFPGRISELPTVTFANGVSYPVGAEELRGTGYVMFYVDYSAVATTQKEPAQPSEIASVRWSSPSGVIDGIEGDHRLTGRVLTVSKTISVDVVVRPAGGDRSTISGQAWFHELGPEPTTFLFGYGLFLSAATTDPAGVAIATGRIPTVQKVKGSRAPLTCGSARQRCHPGLKTGSAGGLLAAGILPPGATDIRAIRTSDSNATGQAVQQILPDGRVIFAIAQESPGAVDPSKDSISAVTWTDYAGNPARKDVIQKRD